MEPLGFLEVSSALSGRVEAPASDLPQNKIADISIDSRSVSPGALFFALPGTKTDGHAFVHDALAKGAVGCVVSRMVERASPSRQILVNDVEKALMRLAAWYRGRIKVPVVGITGSSGKTTTKEILAHLLSMQMPVLKAHASYNNEIGVPLTLLSWEKEKKAVVLEMAMRGRGQIASLCRAARPTHGLITSIGEAHVGLLGSIQAIADAKGELLEALPEDGGAFLNGQDGWSSYLSKKARCPVRLFGFSSDSWVFAQNIVETWEGTRAVLSARGERVEILLSLLGVHNLLNFLGAAAVAISLGVPLEKVARGASSCKPLHGRLEVVSGKDGVLILDDSYNANPSSLNAAMQTVNALSCEGKRVLALGDMLELGDFAPEAHAGAGKVLPSLRFQALFTLGDLAEKAYLEAKHAGKMEAFHFADHASMLKALRGYLKPKDILLVKGSRKMEMEKIVEGLQGG